MNPKTSGGQRTLSSPPCSPYSPCPSPPSPPRSAPPLPSPLLPALLFLLYSGVSGAQADCGPLLPRTWYSALCRGNWSGPERSASDTPTEQSPEGGLRPQVDIHGVSIRENAHCTLLGRFWGPCCSIPGARMLSRAHLINCFRTSYMTGSLSIRSAWLLSVSSISSTCSSSGSSKAVTRWAGGDGSQVAPYKSQYPPSLL